MASVTGYTAERMKAIEDASVVNGALNVNKDLILTRFNGTTINAGSLLSSGLVICTAATRPSSPTNGMGIYETDTKRVYIHDGTIWRIQGTYICTSTTRPTVGLYDGLIIYETDTDQFYIYNGTNWLVQGTYICTSTTRPTIGLYVGLKIYETDTNRRYYYTGSVWTYEGGGTNPTAARAFSSSPQNLNGIAFTQIGFGTEDYDYGNNFTNSAYIVPHTGACDVRSIVALIGANNPQRLIISLFKNGVEFLRGMEITSRGLFSGDNWSLEYSQIAQVVAADILTIHLYNGQTSVCVAQNPYCTFQARMIP